MKYAHQGDLYIEKVSDELVDLGGTPVEPIQHYNKSTGKTVEVLPILAGETGHMHGIWDTKAFNPTMLEVKELEPLDGFNRKALTVKVDELKIEHEEHKAITLTRGTYIINNQRNQGLDDIIRPVVD